jgi:hypothetical protein
LTNSAKRVGLIRADICGREKLMHTIPLNFGPQTDRAGVAERAIFATPNALNLQRAKNQIPYFAIFVP